MEILIKHLNAYKIFLTRKNMYTIENFKTKKALKTAIKTGKVVKVYQPGPFGGNEPVNGVVFLEGPHYPEPHKWYAEGTLKDGILIKVK